ncbi:MULTISPECIES: hypothetical protein [unclassified Massilia]|uniref:oxidoreductase n=1 Tax=unclassified Massilia TaxID=2609279 RepID=UPI0017872777|nr:MULTISPECIES: hypothetical protein [unclassified Massilia]MBD8529207.1 hypothetical protein [Massilia sp. CFBP 13647]MBD8672601.1 hypothetical protein [Massilia sp. CFBP 13721]
MQSSVDKQGKKFFVGLNTGFVDENLNPDSRCIDFYSSRSRHKLYCTIVGNVVLPSGFSTNKKTARISHAPAWNHLAEAITEQGAVPGIQFSSTWSGFEGKRRFVAHNYASTFKFYQSVGAQITQREIAALIVDLSDATRIAVDHGFRHIQLHAAHGYFFNLVTHPLFSSHSQWTCSYIQSWLDELHTKGIETSIRVSMTTGWPEIDCEYIAGMSRLYDLIVNYTDLSDGFYNLDKRKIYPSTKDLANRRFNLSTSIAAEYPSKMFILSGQAKDYADNLRENLHLGFCRDLIANPNFLLDMINGCVLCNKCHYFSRREEHLFCPEWEKVIGINNLPL